MLLDFSEIVVHIQRTEEREFYDLERLWKDCPRVEFEDKDKTRATVGAGAGASATPAASDADRPAGSW